MPVSPIFRRMYSMYAILMAQRLQGDQYLIVSCTTAIYEDLKIQNTQFSISANSNANWEVVKFKKNAIEIHAFKYRYIGTQNRISLISYGYLFYSRTAITQSLYKIIYQRVV